VLGSLLITCALALARYGQSLWFDEAATVWFTRLPIVNLLLGRCDPNPPGYYLLLKAWQALGENEAWLRLPSLFGAVLAVPATYQVGSRLAAKWPFKEVVHEPAQTSLATATKHRDMEKSVSWPFVVLSALLLALHPLQTWYASEARMYALAQCAGLAVVWFGLRLMVSPSGDKAGTRRALVWYWLVTVLGLLIGFSTLLAWAVLQLLWLARGRPRARLWLSSQGAVLLPVIILSLVPGQRQTLGQVHYSIFLSIQAARLGVDLTLSTAKWLLLAGLLGAVSAAILLAVFWRNLVRPLERSSVQYLIFGAWLVLLVFGIIPRGFTLKRFLVVVLPYAALLVAYLAANRSPAIQKAFVGLGLVAAIISVATYQREPWRMVITDWIRDNADRQQVMWVDEDAVPAFEYYLRQSRGADAAATWTPLRASELPRLPVLAPGPGDPLWLLMAENRYRRLIALLPSAFYEEYELMSQQHENGIALYRFQRRLQPNLEALPPFARTPSDEWGLLVPSPLGNCGPQ
jgi:hypothetical protein